MPLDKLRANRAIQESMARPSPWADLIPVRSIDLGPRMRLDFVRGLHRGQDCVGIRRMSQTEDGSWVPLSGGIAIAHDIAHAAVDALNEARELDPSAFRRGAEPRK